MVFKRRVKRSYGQIVVQTVYPRGGWLRAGSYIIHRLRRIPDKPHRIARGVFAGIFVSFTPFFGMHLLLAAGMSWAIGGNLVASLLATLISNPLTFPFIMEGSVGLGNYILHQPGDMHLGRIVGQFGRASAEVATNIRAIVLNDPMHWQHVDYFLAHVFWPFLIGGLVPGLIFGLSGYYLSLPLVAAYQKRRSKKLRDRIEKLRAMRAKNGGGPKATPRSPDAPEEEG